MRRTPLRRSPFPSDCSDIKDPDQCDAKVNCYYDYNQNECRRKRSPTFQHSPYYNLDSRLPVENLRNVYQYLYGNNLRLIDYYPHNPQYILENIATAPEEDLIELLNYLPDGTDWFLQEISQRLKFRRDEDEYEDEDLLEIVGQSGHYPLILLLLVDGNMNPEDINDIMVGAALGGHSEIVERMVELGATDFDSTMIRAAEGGHLEIFERMVELGATDFDRAMQVAAERGHLDIVERMIELGDTDFDFPMLLSAIGGHPQIVERMIELGATNFDSALEGAAAESGHAGIVERMIELGATDFDAALEGAARAGHDGIVERMVELGATDFDTAMRYAAESGHAGIVERMIELGARDFDTAMEEAAESGHLEIVERLRELQRYYNRH